MSDKIFDVTGAELAPGDREHCQGNGEHPDFEICCDNCDYFLKCYPEYQQEVDDALFMLWAFHSREADEIFENDEREATT